MIDFPPMDPTREARARLDLKLDSIIEKARKRLRAEAAAKRAPRAKNTTPEIEAEINRRFEAGEFQRDLAKAFGLSERTISRAVEKTKRRLAGLPVNASRFSDDDVMLMREMRRNGASLQELSGKFGSGWQTISRIVTGVAYKHLPGGVRMAATRDGNNKRAKLTSAQVEEVKRRVAAGERCYRLAREFEVSNSAIFYILHPEKLAVKGAKRKAA